MKDGDKCWVWHAGAVVEATFRGPLTYLVELPDGTQITRLLAAICRDEREREAFLEWHEQQKADVKVERCANSAGALAICSPVDAEKGVELRHRIAAEQDTALMREIEDQANNGSTVQEPA